MMQTMTPRYTPQHALTYHHTQACRPRPEQPVLDTPLKHHNNNATSSPTQEPGSALTKSRLATKGPWTTQEDAFLLELVHEIGAEKWVMIAQRLGTRSGKQCRERYHNHLNPSLKRSPFSAEEEEQILSLYAQMGPKWANIAKHMPGRSDNAIKNYYNTALQRRQRKKTSPASVGALSSSSANFMQRSVSQPYPTSSPLQRRRLSFSRARRTFQLPTPEVGRQEQELYQLPTPDTIHLDGEQTSYFSTPYFVPSPPKSPSPHSATSNVSSSPSFERRVPPCLLPPPNWSRGAMHERRFQLAPLMMRTVSEPIREKMSIHNLLA